LELGLSFSNLNVGVTMDKMALRIGVVVFGAIAIASRLVPHEYNFAAFGAFALFCGCYLRGFAAWVVPLVTYVVGEALARTIGVPSLSPWLLTFILIGYAFSSTCGFALRHVLSALKLTNSIGGSLPVVLGASVAGSIGFFLITNFASWLDPLMQYPRTFTGLVNCYVMGIPFYRWTLFSDVIFGQAFFAGYLGMAALLAGRSRSSSARS
jgi:mannitol-specific phosphotransferase system IIBC component